MPYRKTIVCLANSRKMSGRCIAGKEIDDRRCLGGWIRPVSDRPTQEISEEERQFKRGGDPKLLDIIQIEMLESRPHAPQLENHLINPRSYWVNEGKATWDEVKSATDEVHGALWINGSSSYNGTNDRIPEARAACLSSSLLLIEPEDLVISVAVEGADFNNPKRKVRAQFKLNNESYVIAVTDPIATREYLAKDDGEYAVDVALLCVSIGEPYQGNCYKLAAAVITPDQVG
ncbi:MAG: dual OB domain-containing protein [Terriglobales bacterium]